jgi:hypothetical protein
VVAVAAFSQKIEHYTVFLKVDGVWIYFDDLQDYPVVRDPFTQWSDSFVETESIRRESKKTGLEFEKIVTSNEGTTDTVKASFPVTHLDLGDDSVVHLSQTLKAILERLRVPVLHLPSVDQKWLLDAALRLAARPSMQHELTVPHLGMRDNQIFYEIDISGFDPESPLAWTSSQFVNLPSIRPASDESEGKWNAHTRFATHIMSWRKEVTNAIQDGVYRVNGNIFASEVAADILLKSDISDNKRKTLQDHSIDNYIPKDEQEIFRPQLDELYGVSMGK